MKNNELILLRRDPRPLKFHYKTFEPFFVFIHSLFQKSFTRRTAFLRR